MPRGTLDPAPWSSLRLPGSHRLWPSFPTGSSLAATEGISVDSFSSGYLDVSVHRVPFLSDDSTPAAGFPHSDTCGSMVTCTSPQLFAAYRVLHRLIWPRHPPYALTCLTLCLHRFSEFLRFVKSFSFSSKKRFVRFVLCSCQGTGLSLFLERFMASQN